MSLCQDRQIKGFLLFLTLFALLFVGTATVLTIYQVNGVEALWLKHDEAVSSSLLEQGVPKEVIAVAFTNTDISEDGRSLLAAAGLGKQSESSMRPYFNQFQRSAFCTMLCTVLFFLFVLAVGIFVFFWKRKRLYQQADKILLNYINGDYSCHLPQNYEGAIYQVFSSVEQLATMLQSKNETERKAKEFLKDTISDISHQLKTPLAALAMYQEIIESEPENAETVKQFAAKMGTSLKRMEQLILSMLKITRLDTGNIIFEKKSCRVSELIAHSVNELTARAKNENKQIQIDGDGEQKLICDMEWTGEAIGNIVKNALDHTQVGGIVRITWNRTPAMFQIFISDNGSGIAPEDIHHIKNISNEEASIIASRPDVKVFSPYGVLNYRGDLGYTLGGKNVAICGCDESYITEIWAGQLEDGFFPQASNEALVTENVKQIMGVAIGDSIAVETPDGDKLNFTISGFMNNTDSIMSGDSYGIILNTEDYCAIYPNVSDGEPNDYGIMFFTQFANTRNIQGKIADLKEQCNLSNEQISSNNNLLGLLGQSRVPFLLQVYLAAAVLFVLVKSAILWMLTSKDSSTI